jgi:hypothetical protein
MHNNNYEVEDLTINNCYHIIDEKYVNISAMFGNKQVLVHIKMSEFKEMVRSLERLGDNNNDDSCGCDNNY